MDTSQSVRFLEWPEAGSLGVAVAVTTRNGGVSEGVHESLNLGLHVGDDPGRVIENRRRAANAFGVDLGNVVFAEQVHGVGTTVVGHAERGRGTLRMDDAVTSTDILVTTALDTTLAILVADCVPMALLDPEARVLAAIHAGWRGTASQASRRAIETMSALGAEPERIVAFIGPGVHPARYEVDEVVLEALRKAVAPGELIAGGRSAGRKRTLAGRSDGGESPATGAGGGRPRQHFRLWRHHRGRRLLQRSSSTAMWTFCPLHTPYGAHRRLMTP